MIKKKIFPLYLITSLFFIDGCGAKGTKLSELINITHEDILSIDISGGPCVSFATKMKEDLFKDFFNFINIKYIQTEKIELDCSIEGINYMIHLSNERFFSITQLNNKKLYFESLNSEFISSSKVTIPSKFGNRLA